MNLAALVLAFVVAGVPAGAQAPPPDSFNPPPVRLSTDRNGVNPATGLMSFAFGEVSTGGAEGEALTFSMQWGGTSVNTPSKGWIQYNQGTYYVSVGASVERFSESGGSYTSLDGTGSTLSRNGNIFTYRLSDGTVMTFAASLPTAYPQADIVAWIENVARPDGVTLEYHYNEIQGTVIGSGEPGPTATRVQSITNNLGYQLHFRYVTDAFLLSNTDPSVGARHVGNLYRFRIVTAINNAVEYCDPQAFSCAGLTEDWPTASFGYTVDQTTFESTAISATDNLGRTTRVALEHGRITQITRPEPGDEPIEVAYTNNRVTQVDDGAGIWTYAYTPSGFGQITQTVIDPPVGGNVTVAIDTAVGLPSAVTNGENETTSYDYDSQGRLIEITYPEGNRVEYAYDSRSNLETVTRYPKSGSGTIETSAAYPASCPNPVTCNRPTSTTDAEGNVTNYEWNSAHGAIEEITLPDPDGAGGAPRPQTRFHYENQYARYKNASGTIVQAPSAVTRLIRTEACKTGTSCDGLAREREQLFDYNDDTAGATNLLLASRTARQGNGGNALTTAYTYDPFGNVLTLDGPLPGTGDTTHYRYNAGIQLAGVVAPDPDGSGVQQRLARRFIYDDNGNVTRIDNGTLASASAAWSTLDRLNYTQRLYDDIARLERMRIRADSGTVLARTDYTYDLASRLRCTAQRMTDLASAAFHACTQPVPTPSVPDRITRNFYDAAGRIEQVRVAAATADVANVATYSYNPNGTVATVEDGNGNLTSYVYDGHDRLVRMRYPNASGSGSSTSDDERYSYDDNGNLLTHTLRDDTVIAYAYDGLDRRTFMDLPETNPVLDVTYGYDNFGNLTAASRPGLAMSFTYDIHGRQLTETGPMGTITRTFREDGLRERLTWPDGKFTRTTYTATGQRRYLLRNATSGGANIINRIYYDAFNRPTHWYGDAGSSATRVRQNFGFDDIGRLTDLFTGFPGTADDLDQEYGYNPASQIDQRTRSNAAYLYEPPADGTTSYTPDGLNRYDDVDPPGAGSIAPVYDARGNLIEYGADSFTYDSLNRLTSATMDGALVGYNYDPLGRLYFVNPPGTNQDVRLQWDGAQIVTAYRGSSGSTIRRRYVHTPGSLGAPEASFQGSGMSLADQSYLLTDERGSVIALAAGSDGTVTGINTYGPYGEPGANNQGAFQYAGQLRPFTDLYYMRNRWYHPELGRFLQTDPIGYEGGMNLYAYVGNDPVNFVDPWGLGPFDEGEGPGQLPKNPVILVTGCQICLLMMEQFIEAAFESQDFAPDRGTNEQRADGGGEDGEEEEEDDACRIINRRANAARARLPARVSVPGNWNNRRALQFDRQQYLSDARAFRNAASIAAVAGIAIPAARFLRGAGGSWDVFGIAPGSFLTSEGLNARADRFEQNARDIQDRIDQIRSGC